MTPSPPLVEIHYHRPPDRTELFRQEWIEEEWIENEPAGIVTFARALDRPRPLMIDGKVALEEGSDVVWFTFPGLWHDIGLFHRADGTLTGLYANILTPCRIEPGGRWWTTDLFLDLWIPAGKAKGTLPLLLDEAEWAEARERGWITPEMGDRAMEEALRLQVAAADGRWPPPIVNRWSRERILNRPR